MATTEATMQVVHDLERLVAFPTVSNRPLTELAAFLATRFEDLGFRVERFVDPQDAEKCSLICTIGPPSEDGLVLSGHMDVVPTEGQPWTTAPFTLTERDGKLYGRGSADMKGFFAATLQALARIPRSAYTRELTLIWTHDEELGCLGSGAMVDAWEDIGRPLPKACLIGEPTSFEMLRMHLGHVRLEVEIEGEAAHSSRPDLGRNAIEAAADVIGAVRELARELESEGVSDLPELDRPWVPVNVAQIEGGRAINIVPDHCILRIGYRPLPGMEPLAVHDRMVERIEALSLDTPVRVRPVTITPSMLTPRQTPLEGLLRGHAAHDHCGAALFGTDGGNLARLGLQPLIFGPGSIDVAHKADEYIPVDELVRAVDVIEDVVRRRCCAG